MKGKVPLLNIPLRKAPKSPQFSPKPTSKSKPTLQKKKKITFADEVEGKALKQIYEYDLPSEEKYIKKAAYNDLNINLIYRHISHKEYDKALLMLIKASIITDINRQFTLENRTILHLVFLDRSNINQDLVIELIELLISKGASLEATDIYGNYPLAYSSLAIAANLFRKSLNFEELSQDIIKDIIHEVLNPLSIRWNYRNYEEIAQLTNEAHECSLRIKVLPKSKQSFLKAFAYLYNIKMNKFIHPNDLRESLLQKDFSFCLLK